MLTENKIWLGLDKRGRVQATWYRGCAQPFAKWRKAVKSLGYRAVCATLSI